MTLKEYLNDLNFEPNLDQLDRGDADLAIPAAATPPDQSDMRHRRSLPVGTGTGLGGLGSGIGTGGGLGGLGSGIGTGRGGSGMAGPGGGLGPGQLAAHRQLAAARRTAARPPLAVAQPPETHGLTVVARRTGCGVPVDLRGMGILIRLPSRRAGKGPLT